MNIHKTISILYVVSIQSLKVYIANAAFDMIEDLNNDSQSLKGIYISPYYILGFTTQWNNLSEWSLYKLLSINIY